LPAIAEKPSPLSHLVRVALYLLESEDFGLVRIVYLDGDVADALARPLFRVLQKRLGQSIVDSKQYVLSVGAKSLARQEDYTFTCESKASRKEQRDRLSVSDQR
jgi:hypothetical protein